MGHLPDQTGLTRGSIILTAKPGRINTETSPCRKVKMQSKSVCLFAKRLACVVALSSATSSPTVVALGSNPRRQQITPSNEDMNPALTTATNQSYKKNLGLMTTRSDVYENCKLNRPDEKNVTPTWLASYPQSGSEEIWQIIEALTGMVVDEEYSNHGRADRGVAVAVKTHFPSQDATDVYTNWTNHLDIQHAILLIRNPLKAIQANAKYLHEQKHSTDSSRRFHSSLSSSAPSYIPIAYWIPWRNHGFVAEFDKWMEHIKWWVDMFHERAGEDKLHLIVYEKLVSSTIGLDEMWRLGFFLQHIDAATADSLIPIQRWSCVWSNIVEGKQVKLKSGRISKATSNRKAKKSTRDRDDTRTNTLTSAQLQPVIHGLTELRDRYSKSYPELATLINGYLLETSALQESTERSWR